ncbi:MAG: NrfD/PsrC family molybdoenzyme membrane anchor subunit [Thermoanaerobaculales bacterium]|jgi:Ni/Fe-hydrogenase subunit HybB-like protein|nr:NrfD/PsrC family molybdoenzyme membrane anchor subunit [Thermoanaerobaculales bacterium]
MSDVTVDAVHEPTRGGWFTPFNIITGIILIGGAVLLAIRFTHGLAATTNLSHTYPWGLWIGFDVMSGVALAAGGFVTSSAVYLFGMKEYKPVVRAALLTGFLGYFLVVLGLLADLGRPWRLPYPFIKSPGPTSPLFEVSLCVALYLTVLFIESTPAALEWLGLKKARKVVGSMTIALTIFGLILSTMHQSTLGAMLMVAPTRLHPLWYSAHIPVHFFVSAVAAGLSMVIVEGMISHRAYHHQVQITKDHFHRINFGLAKAAAVTLAVYTAIKVIALAIEDEWHLLATGWGAYWLVEILGFVVLPCALFAIGYRERKLLLVRVAAVITVIGIMLNRFNVIFIVFNWNNPTGEIYVPNWMEIWITVAFITFAVVAFKLIADRMPIMYEHPDWKGTH